jgi:transposase
MGYGYITKVMTRRVRSAILDGATIAAIQQRFDVPKGFVEKQRAILKEKGEIPDARCTGTKEEIKRLDGLGWDVRDIAKYVGKSTSYVYQHRR